MSIEEILNEKGMTKYCLAKLSKVPNSTLSKLCKGRTSIEKCSAETIYRIAKALDISMESLLEHAMNKKKIDKLREQSYEYGLPGYLQHDLDMYKKALKEGSTLLDCYWGKLYGSINAAQIDDGAITPEHAEYLRQKYLWR